jgi:membrane-associated protease RseP (regulator of RpoE activity)
VGSVTGADGGVKVPPPGWPVSFGTDRPALAPTSPRWGVHLFLLLLTLLTTLSAGALLAGVDPLGTRFLVVRGWGVPYPTGLDLGRLGAGLPFALPFMSILLGHEMGHYVAARRHGVRVTLPFFLPMIPTLSVVGTLGAFIRIRSPIALRSQLLDIGVAGPAVSFLLSIPVLAAGLALSEPLPGTADVFTPYVIRFLGETIWIGDSLAVGGLARLLVGPAVGTDPVLLHPLAFAGWLGLFVTALNLIPLGQLDGGHVLHALSGRLQRRVGRLALLALLPMGLLWWGWWLWAAVILLLSRRRIAHPPVLREEVELGSVRRRVALAAIGVFILTFVPIPIRI